MSLLSRGHTLLDSPPPSRLPLNPVVSSVVGPSVFDSCRVVGSTYPYPSRTSRNPSYGDTPSTKTPKRRFVKNTRGTVTTSYPRWPRLLDLCLTSSHSYSTLATVGAETVVKRGITGSKSLVTDVEVKTRFWTRLKKIPVIIGSWNGRFPEDPWGRIGTRVLFDGVTP